MANAGHMPVLVAAVALASAGLLSAAEYDKSLLPKAYGVLGTERLLFPVDMGNWPAKIGAKHQLFVDDYLIKSKTGLTRQFHKFKRHPANPLWTPPKRMSFLVYVMRTPEGNFRLWYAQRVGAKNADGKVRRHPTGYLESDDGIRWRAPNLGVVTADGNTNNNYVFRKSLEGIFHDPREKDPSQRFKGLAHMEPDNDKTTEIFEGYWLYVSPDGIRWKLGRREPVAASLLSYGIPQTGVGDTSSWRWDSVLKKYICNAKFVLRGKYRAYGIAESDDLIHWSPPRMMFYRDALDPGGLQFYAHHTFNYESMWFGLIKTMEIFQPKGKSGHWKHCHLQLSISRDGRHYTRCPDRSPILPIPKNGLDMDYPCIAIGSPIRMGNELWFYYNDRRHWARPGPRPAWEKGKADLRLFLATLRVDGFASLNAGDKPGRVVTRPLTFAGGKLFVNAEVGEGGYVRAALRTAHPVMRQFVHRNKRPPWGKLIEPYTPANCNGVTGSTFAGRITWKGRPTLPPTADASPRLVFELKNAKLYSFWIE